MSLKNPSDWVIQLMATKRLENTPEHSGVLIQAHMQLEQAGCELIVEK